jgi:hypothetical protein
LLLVHDSITPSFQTTSIEANIALCTALALALLNWHAAPSTIVARPSAASELQNIFTMIDLSFGKGLRFFVGQLQEVYES